MKRIIWISFIMLVISVAGACVNKRIMSEAGTAASTSVLQETMDSKDYEESVYEKWQMDQYIQYWSTYENPKLNDEVKTYGYDNNGELILPLSELEHCEEILPHHVIATPAIPKPISNCFVEGTAYYQIYSNSLHLVGYVTDLISHCTREDIYMDHDEKYGLPVQWSTYYSGYTETKFMITDVIDVGRKIPDSENHYDYLIGKEITIRQFGYWYFDDNGNMKKEGINLRYTYVLKPNTPAVIEVFNESCCECKTGEEIYQLLTELPIYDKQVMDFYPAENQKGEDITSIELLKDYFIELDKEYGGIYQPWRKANEVKERISF